MKLRKYWYTYFVYLFVFQGKSDGAVRTCDRGLAAERRSSSGVSAPPGGVIAAEEGGPSKAVKELQLLAGKGRASWCARGVISCSLLP